MVTQTFNFIGRGAFSLGEASRLTGIPSRRIRRWLVGYEYRSPLGARYSPPPVHRDYVVADGKVSLSFADMIEVRFLDHFLKTGVSWMTIRLAAAKASELLGRDHPFSSRVFKTDGKTILTEIGSSADARELLDLVRDQVAFKRILDPYLYKGLEFGPSEDVARWWHEAGDRKIVIDPKRSLGRPIVAKWGVPTQTLADAFRVEQSLELVAAQFEIPKAGVAAAVEFEQRLAA